MWEREKLSNSADREKGGGWIKKNWSTQTNEMWPPGWNYPSITFVDVFLFSPDRITFFIFIVVLEEVFNN